MPYVPLYPSTSSGFPSDRVYCKIKIKVNDDTLKVMDVIDFDEERKIIKIEAYNG